MSTATTLFCKLFGFVFFGMVLPDFGVGMLRFCAGFLNFVWFYLYFRGDLDKFSDLEGSGLRKYVIFDKFSDVEGSGLRKYVIF
jgi:hypothetical protein